MKNKNNHNNDNINGNNSIKKHQKSLICIYTNFEVLSFSREKRLIMIIISFQKVLESVSFCFVGYNLDLSMKIELPIYGRWSRNRSLPKFPNSSLKIPLYRSEAWCNDSARYDNYCQALCINFMCIEEG